jgi:predicted NAD/FAD-dependent oxidoreductase
MKKIAIIGAGLAGLTVANMLKDYTKVKIFDKACRIGGRVSTKYSYPYSFDHGAQYFTAKTPEFRTFIEPMLNNGIIDVWKANFSEIKNEQVVNQRFWNNEYKHYVGTPNMDAIARYLSQGLNILTNTDVNSVMKSDDHWLIYDKYDKFLGKYDWLICAIPPRKLKQLVDTSVEFNFQIDAIEMKSCFSLILGYNIDINLDFDVALVHDEIISWISVNSSKPDRKSSNCFLVNSTNRWADQNISHNKNEITQIIFQRLKRIIPAIASGKPNYKVLKTWRDANIGKQDGPKYFIDIQQNIAACGDWCIQGRIESAFTSAFSLGNRIKQDFLDK